MLTNNWKKKILEWMPAVSQKQYQFMQAVASGKVTKKGLSPSKAREWLKGVNPKTLPVRKK